jgi:hypothetical protein
MRATVTIDENREVVVTLIPDDEEKLVKGITVIVQGDDAPIMRAPFFIHGKMLHTVCSLVDENAIDRVEW